jgi:hypothetical protein
MTTPPSGPFGTPPGRSDEPNHGSQAPDSAHGQPRASGQPPAGQPNDSQPPAYPPMPAPPPFPDGEPGPRIQPPSSILNAVRLMYVGAALSALAFIVGLLTQGSLRDEIADQNPDLDAGELDAVVTGFVVVLVIVGLLSVGLWIWMAETNRRGRKWARIVATVLGGLNIVITLYRLSQNIRPGVLDIILIALAAAVLWFLYRPESNQYYDAVAGTPRL